MNRTRKLVAVVTLVFGFSVSASYAENADMFYMSLEELLSVEVISSTKTKKNLALAPSVVTVWIQKDFKEMGLRSIRELLERTVGFFSSMQFSTPMIGNRGFIADGNEAFLFLIDGHSINSLSSTGAGIEYIVPNLNKVKKIEIIRGPGSTLWGNDAALALVNIITKNGSDATGLRITTSYGSEDKQKMLHLSYGEKVDDDVDFLLSMNYAQIEGFGEHVDVYNGPYQNSDFNSADRSPLFGLEDTWEIHAKARIRDITLTAHTSDIIGPDLWGGSSRDTAFWSRKRHTYLEVGFDKHVGDGWGIETKVFSDFMVTSPHTRNKNISPDATEVREENLSKEQNIGLDVLVTKRVLENHALTLGLRYVNTEIDPVISYGDLDFVGEDSNLALKVDPSRNDISEAIFAEDDWKINDELSVIFGIRLDRNNLREDSDTILPRLGIVYSPSAPWIFKYLYNTGVVRPPVNIGFLGSAPIKTTKIDDDTGENISFIEVGADRSEEVQAHEIQMIYQADAFEIFTTLYQVELQDFFTWSGQYATDDGTPSGTITTNDGQLTRFSIINANTITSRGLEFEVNYRPSISTNVYGNLSYVFSSKTDSFIIETNGFVSNMQGGSLFSNDKTLNGFPHLMFNLGINYRTTETTNINVHWRYWDKLSTLANNADPDSVEYVDLGSESFVDFNYFHANVFDSSVDINIFVKNLFDNDDSKVGFISGGYWTDRARSLGFIVSMEI